MTEPKPEVLKWLLEEGSPSVRYYTLRDLLYRGSDDPELIAAKKSIMNSGAVPEIIAKISAPEYAPMREDFYSKYKGLSWQLLILAELGSERTPEVAEACELLLTNAQERELGGISVHTSAKTGGGLASFVIPCLTGNVTFALIRLGYLADPRVQKAIGWMTTYQRFDDAEGDPPKGPPYDRYEMCWGRHTCHMGAVKVLKALAEIPADRRSPEVIRTIDAGVEYLLKHHVHKRSHDLSKVSKPGWLKFGFPLMYQTDVLEILEVLLKLGIHDDRMEEALGVVASKRDTSDRWALENNYRNPLLVNLEKKGPSKWITLRAMRVLQEIWR